MTVPLLVVVGLLLAFVDPLEGRFWLVSLLLGALCLAAGVAMSTLAG